MPYNIRKINGKYCVVNKQTGRNTGCSDSLEMATKHLRALYAAEKGDSDDVRYQYSADNHSVSASSSVASHIPSNPIGLAMQQADYNGPMIEIDRTIDGEPIMVPLDQVHVQPSKPVYAARAEDIQAVAKAFGVDTHPLQPTANIQAPPRPTPPEPPQQPRPQVIEQAIPLIEYVQADLPAQQIEPVTTTICTCPNCNGQMSQPQPVQPTQPTVEAANSDAPTTSITWSTCERVLPPADTFMQRILDAGRSLMGNDSMVAEHKPFELYKVRGLLRGEDGVEHTVEELRFVAYWSNRYVDRSGAPIPLAAHQRMIKRVDEGNAYPVLLQWHSIGTEYGQVDCMDISEGFNVAFGYILPGKEEIAYKIAEDKNIGMSHGSLYRTDRVNGEIIDFYPFELTTLPIERAKNQWFTGIDIGQWVNGKEYEDMGFAPEKVAFLKSKGLTDEDIAQSEQKTTAFKAKLAELGIEFKGDEPPDTASLMEAIGSLAESNKALKDEIEALKAVPSQQQVTGEGTQVVNPDGSSASPIVAENSDIQKLIDDGIARALAGAQANAGAVHVASKSDENVVGKVPVNNQANLTGWGDKPAETFLKTALGNQIKVNGQN